MSYELPAPIAAYVQATNTADANAFLAIFTDDAIAFDEGHEYRGVQEIAQWRAETTAKYQTQLEVTGAKIVDDETVLTALVSGTFDGSPVELDFHFTLRGDKIAALRIP
jgi:uncharacterized protein (TIGR02246 family)